MPKKAYSGKKYGVRITSMFMRKRGGKGKGKKKCTQTQKKKILQQVRTVISTT